MNLFLTDTYYWLNDKNSHDNGKMINIHKKAEEYFNKEFDDLLLKLIPAQVEKQKPKKATSLNHIFSKRISKSDILALNRTARVNGFGRETAKYFIVDKREIGLGENEYTDFDELVGKLSRRKEIIMLLSKKYITEKAFDWFENKYTGKLGSSNKFIEYLISESNNDIKTLKVCLPIDFISIERPFEIGNIKINYLTKNLFDSIENNMINNLKIDEKEVLKGMETLRKKYQGKVISEIKITAECNKCIEIAKYETDRAIMILKCFSPSAFLPRIHTYWGRMGQVNVPVSHCLIFEDDELFTINENKDEEQNFHWEISCDLIKELNTDGLQQASDLLKKENSSNLEELLLNCYFLFSKCISTNDFQDKLVYSLVTLETLLLMNTTEPIQSNVGLRLAFVTSKNPEERKKIKKLINDAYTVRSSYIHHGRSKIDYNLLRNLQHQVWTALRNTLIFCEKYNTQNEFIEYINQAILS